MSSEPLVSIYIPTHNRAGLIKRAIESVFSQTYQNIELIICDDGSMDNTQEVIDSFKNKGYRIISLHNPEPRGACYSRNRCIEASSGEFVTGLDDDDYFTENRILEFVEYYKKFNYQFMCSTFLITKNENINKSRNVSGWIGFDKIKKRNVIDSQVFIKRDFILDVGGYDVSMPAWQDYDLWFRLLKQGLSCYKINNYSYVKDISHDKQRITTSSKAYEGYKKFIAKHSNDLSNQDKNSLYYCDLINRGEAINAFDLLRVYSSTGVKAIVKKIAHDLTKVFR